MKRLDLNIAAARKERHVADLLTWRTAAMHKVRPQQFQAGSMSTAK
jgi:hypothetical protein